MLPTVRHGMGERALLKILKSKKGLTLVELIIGMVVLAIMLAAATAILFPMMRFQSRANELAEQNYILDTLANQIIHDISMTIYPGPPTTALSRETEATLEIPIHGGAGGNVIYTITPAGVIERQQSGEEYTFPLLPERFHQRMDEAGLRVEEIELTRIETNEGITYYTLTLTLSNETETQDATLTFTRDYTARPLALN